MLCLFYKITHFLLYISARKFSKAVDLYTEAINANSNNAVYWANRSFAHTKLEEYGSAIADASKAIEIDPKYIKVEKITIPGKASSHVRDKVM